MFVPRLLPVTARNPRLWARIRKRFKSRDMDISIASVFGFKYQLYNMTFAALQRLPAYRSLHQGTRLPSRVPLSVCAAKISSKSAAKDVPTGECCLLCKDRACQSCQDCLHVLGRGTSRNFAKVSTCLAAVTSLEWQSPLSILKYPDPRLRAVNAKIGVFNETLLRLAKEMIEVMYT